MPAKNRIKPYVENGFYHLFNRGVEKRNIFLDDQDFRVFLYFLKLYLSPPNSTGLTITTVTRTDPVKVTRIRPTKNLYGEIKLLAYCLMPNHFHLLIKQKTANGITKFMRQICTSYVMYFNHRYNRVGGLFQDIYKAVLIETDPYLLHLSRYIHLNPTEMLVTGTDPVKCYHNYPYSSYSQYLGKCKANWIHPEEILSFFKTAQKTNLKDILSYQSFIEDYSQQSKEILGNSTLE